MVQGWNALTENFSRLPSKFSLRSQEKQQTVIQQTSAHFDSSFNILLPQFYRHVFYQNFLHDSMVIIYGMRERKHQKRSVARP